MCLALLRFDPADEWPLLLASIRDEELARPAAGPGQWWPETYPGVLGGQDLRAGGTWFAVDPERRIVAAVFTPGGVPAPRFGGRSRGELPLLALSLDALTSIDLGDYPPFALLRAGADVATWHSWSGDELQSVDVAPGMHVANIHGLDATAVSARQARWAPAFAAGVPEPFHAARALRDRWGTWLQLLDSGLEPERADSLLLRRIDPSGSYGTRSIALLAIGSDGLVYDVNDHPGDPAGWVPVLSADAALAQDTRKS